MNPNLRNLIKPSYEIPIIRDLSQIIDRKSRPDLICFKDNILLTIENKTRLFNKIQQDVWNKLSINERSFFNNYFIRYHFDNPYWALNSYRDLIIFKENIRKQVKDRISETIDMIKGSSCEMFRICASLVEKQNLEKISITSGLSKDGLNNVEYRIAVTLIPFYISLGQRNVLINCLKRLQLFCDTYLKNKVHLQLWEIEPLDDLTINGGDPNGYKIKITPIEENTSDFLIIEDKDYLIDMSNLELLKTYNLISNKTSWKACNQCIYYKNYCYQKLKDLRSR